MKDTTLNWFFKHFDLDYVSETAEDLRKEKITIFCVLCFAFSGIVFGFLQFLFF